MLSKTLFLAPIITITLLVVFVIYINYLRTLDSVKAEMNRFVSSFSTQYQQGIVKINITQLNNLTCTGIAKDYPFDVTIVDSEGRVRCDSFGRYSKLEDLSQRPEFFESLNGKSANVTRADQVDPASGTWIFSSSPLYTGNNIDGAVRVSQPYDRAMKQHHAFVYRFIPVGLGLIVLITIFNLFNQTGIYQSIESLSRHLKKILKGKYRSKNYVVFSEPDIIVSLRRSLNWLAEKLEKDRIDGDLKKLESEIIYSQMTNGLFVFNVEGHLVYANPAAEEIFGIQLKGPGNRRLRLSIEEVFRDLDVIQFIERATSASREFKVLDGDREKFFLVEVQILQPEHYKKPAGKIVIVENKTQLRQLEKYRKDFVSNVSHELKTPLTTIQGFAETLLNQKNLDKEQSREFLQIIHDQGTRLYEIVESLLTLSSIEREGELDPNDIEMTNVRELLDRVWKNYKHRAKKKKITCNIDVIEPLEIPVHRVLFEQAVGNLLENSIKYSPESTQVVVSARKNDEGWVEIDVRDFGQGIPKKHLARIFERFYRVDESRSRDRGGSGIGLAIAKHIVKLHHGEIEASSDVGQGSVFRIKIPC